MAFWKSGPDAWHMVCLEKDFPLVSLDVSVFLDVVQITEDD